MKTLCCQTVLLSLQALADGEPALLSRAQLDAHLAGCPACQEEARGMAALSNELAQARRAPAPQSVWPAVRARLESPAPRQPGAGLAWLMAWINPASGSGPARLGWAGAALCWVVAGLLHATAPETARPAVAGGPATLREVLMALDWRPAARPVPAPAGRPRHDLAPAPQSRRAPATAAGVHQARSGGDAGTKRTARRPGAQQPAALQNAEGMPQPQFAFLPAATGGPVAVRFAQAPLKPCGTVSDRA